MASTGRTHDVADGGYRRRLVDDELNELLGDLPAIALEGPRAVGKTASALRRAATVYRLDDDDERSLLAADPSRLLDGEPPILIDEWQRLPQSFDRVRRAVDDGARAGSFLLTGSASPTNPPTHSGAGRIVRLHLRPLSLAEREIDSPTVSLRQLLQGEREPLAGRTEVGLERYVEEILASGFPGLRNLSERATRLQLDGYLDGIVDRDFEQLGREVRRPATLRAWMQAYAAATATTASYEKIRDAATSGQGDKPAKATTLPYRDVLERLWILDPVPAWLPTRNRLARLTAPPKHHLADPALAARLLDVDAAALLQPRRMGPSPLAETGTDWGDTRFARIPKSASAKGPCRPASVVHDGTLLGALFESLATLSIRVYAQAAEARVAHLRTWSGEREVDLIVEHRGRVVAIEVKLGQVPEERDVRHLHWLRQQIGDTLADAVVVTTGSGAYRRADGVAVVPLALLGP